MRIGLFVSPFISAALMQLLGLDGAYWLAAMAAAAAGGLAFTLPDLETRRRSQAAKLASADKASNKGPQASLNGPQTPRIPQLLREHRRAFMTLGTGCYWWPPCATVGRSSFRFGPRILRWMPPPPLWCMVPWAQSTCCCFIRPARSWIATADHGRRFPPC